MPLDSLVSALIEKYSSDPEFSARFQQALQAPPDKIISEIESVLKEEGIEITEEIHQLISEVDWKSQNLGEELRKRITRTRTG